jgi:succinate dehydrogenase / fumarate reductase cytochrome b subunit
MACSSCCSCKCRIPSLVKKYLMAISGLILAAFAAFHMVGNLQMFQSPDHINVYAHFLQHLPPPALWGFRAVMLLAVAIHAATGISLALENRAARGDENYGVKASRAATFAAKTMPYTGLVLLAFVVFHIIHYTIKATALHTAGLTSVVTTDVHNKLFGVFDFPIFKGERVNDAYNMVVAGFSVTPVAVFYVIAMALVLVHLSHGISSLFQTLGLRNEKWRGILNKAALAYGVVVFAGLASVPIAVQVGVIAPDTKCPVAIKAVTEKSKDGKVVPVLVLKPAATDCHQATAAKK